MSSTSASDLEIEMELFEELSSTHLGAPTLEVQAAHLELLHAEQQALVATQGAATTRRAMAGVLGAAAAAAAIALFGLSSLDNPETITATSVGQLSETETTELDLIADSPAPTLGEQPTPSTIAENVAGAENDSVDSQVSESTSTQPRGDSTPLTTNPPPGESTAVAQGQGTATPTNQPPTTSQGSTAPTTSTPVTAYSVPTTDSTSTTNESPGDTAPPEATTTLPTGTILETVLGDEQLDLADLECDGYAVTVVGSDGDDILVGTAGPDVIFGGNGADTIYGLEGADIICGGNGDDTIITGLGVDTAFGENGFDTFEGSPLDTFFQGRGDGPAEESPANP